MAAIPLEELLSPDRAKREEGWHDFAQRYERSMGRLSAAVDKLSGKTPLREGESAFTVLEAYLQEQADQREMESEKLERLHDIVANSIPKVTAEQEAAYKAQKELYDQYQEDLKRQTEAIEKSSQAQIDAVDKEHKEKMAALDAEAAQIKRYEGKGEIAKYVQEFAEAGVKQSKSGGDTTLLTHLFSGFKTVVGESQAERNARIDEIVDMRRKEIQAETEARKASIKEETAARLAAIAEEKKAQVEPVAPEKAREQAIAKAEAELNKDTFLKASAGSEPVVKKQQEFWKDELRQEATEEVIKKDQGRAMAPVVLEDTLPGEAAPVLTAEPAPVEKKEVAAIVPEIPVQPEVTPVEEKAEVGPAPVEEKAPAPKKGVGSGIVSMASSALNGIGALGAVLGPGILIAQVLKDMDKTLPLISTGIGAVAEATRLISAGILSATGELGGYLAELGVKLVESTDIFGSRRSKLEKSGALAEERARVVEIQKAREEEMGGTTKASLSKPGGVIYSTAPQRVEPIYTTPTEERRLRHQAATDTEKTISALETAITRMAEAQEKAAQHQLELGQGTTPLLITNPSLKPFPA